MRVFFVPGLGQSSSMGKGTELTMVQSSVRKPSGAGCCGASQEKRLEVLGPGVPGRGPGLAPWVAGATEDPWFIRECSGGRVEAR